MDIVPGSPAFFWVLEVAALVLIALLILVPMKVINHLGEITEPR